MKTAIVDIDGTISDSRHRLHYVRPVYDNNGMMPAKDYETFHSLCGLDPVIDSVVLLVNMIAQDGVVVLMTGRPNKYREQTQDWLDDNSVCYDALLMRVDGDTRPAPDVKLEMLKVLQNAGHEVFLAIEDQQNVVDMWRANGIHCLQTQAVDTMPTDLSDGLPHFNR